jgi:ABC-type bacteriocin/lantibiotic exporter with double-glycine peptidase domain
MTFSPAPEDPSPTLCPAAPVLSPAASDPHQPPPPGAELEAVISLKNVYHWFGTGDARKHALKDITLDIYPGEIVICTGLFGSGKTYPFWGWI